MATRIAENLTGYEVSIRRVVPVKERGYASWLALSFFPGSRVSILPLDLELSDFDLVMLGCPKWTFSCPPFNELITGLKTHAAKTAVFFMTFGGFDEERFSASMLGKLRKAGFEVRSVLKVKTKKVDTGEYISLVDNFCKGLLRDMAAGRASFNSKPLPGTPSQS